MRVITREKTTVAGDYKDIEYFPIYQPSRRRLPRRSGCKESSAAQKELNRKNAERRLFYLIAENFTGKDRHVTLEYAGKGNISIAQCEKDIENFIRRIRYIYNKIGAELKYLAVIEVGEERGRLHHHIIMSGLTASQLAAALPAEKYPELYKYGEVPSFEDFIYYIWGKGFANADRLRQNDNYEGLAKYLSKAPKGKRRYKFSRNLTRFYRNAEIHDNRTSKRTLQSLILHEADREYYMKLYPGFEPIKIEIKKNEYIKGSYIFIRLRRIGADAPPTFGG